MIRYYDLPDSSSMSESASKIHIIIITHRFIKNNKPSPSLSKGSLDGNGVARVGGGPDN